MTDLLANFSQTTMGAALLSFLQEKGTGISFDHRFEKEVLGAANPNNTIRLKAGLPANVLVGTLAHEARHHVQLQELGHSCQILPPRAVLIRTILMEADAHAFEQRFCEDYAKVTGDSQPLDMHKGRHPEEMPKAELADGQLFLAWVDKIKNSGYVSGAFYKMEAMYYDMECGRPDTLPLHYDAETHVIASMIEKFSTKFGLKQEVILARLEFDANVERALKKADADYRSIHDGRRAVPTDIMRPMSVTARTPTFMQ